MTEPSPTDDTVDDGTQDWSTVRITGNPHRDERDNLATQRDVRADNRDERADDREDRADEREAAADRRDGEGMSTLNHVDNLVRANAESNSTMMRLVEGVRKDSYMREKKIDLLETGLKQIHRLMLMVGVVLAVLVALAVINATNINDARRNAAVTADTAKDAHDTYALLHDCLNAKGECGKQNAAAQTKLLDEIKLYDLVTLYCARINPQLADPQGAGFLACVKDLYPTGPALPRTP